jgi:hypothetical protein
LRSVEIDMASSERGDLTATQTAQRRQHHRNMHSPRPHQFERGGDSLDIPDLYIAPLDPRRIAIVACCRKGPRRQLTLRSARR